MTNIKNNKYYLIFGLIIVIIFAAVGFYILGSKDVNQDTNTEKQYVSDRPGPTDISCTDNSDCDGVCKDDGCLISSCVKNQNEAGGKCACFDLCGG